MLNHWIGFVLGRADVWPPRGAIWLRVSTKLAWPPVVIVLIAICVLVPYAPGALNSMRALSPAAPPFGAWEFLQGGFDSARCLIPVGRGFALGASWKFPWHELFGLRLKPSTNRADPRDPPFLCLLDGGTFLIGAKDHLHVG